MRRCDYLVFSAFLLGLTEISARGDRSQFRSWNKSGASDKGKKNEEREKRILSIFSVVRFSNVGCRSDMTLTGNIAQFRNGTCVTADECSSNSGTASGTCASGFGVCCVYMTDTCGSTVSRNCSYIKNPGFPTAFTGTTACSFTIAKCDASVCDFRLDFDQFTLNGPADTEETDGGACSADTLTTTTSSGQAIPVICGGNSGQHIYLDAGAAAGGTATLAFAFTGTQARMWDIKVTQIPCNSNYGQPDGCLQYLTGTDGRLTTFNFDGTTQQHLASQNYNICIRQEEGFCCIVYTPCPNPADSLLLNNGGMADNTVAKQDANCNEDYITIEGSSCTGLADFANAYCGGMLSSFADAIANCPIRDCSQPFMVGVLTNDAADTAPTMPATNHNRGICLEYMQEPC